MMEENLSPFGVVAVRLQCFDEDFLKTFPFQTFVITDAEDKELEEKLGELGMSFGKNGE